VRNSIHLLSADVTLTMPGLAEVDDEYIDVACHSAVRPSSSLLRRKWQGDTFYFCSPICCRRFSVAPDVLLSTRQVHGNACHKGSDKHETENELEQYRHSHQ